MVKITRVETQKNNPERLNVYLEGEFGFGIARKIAPWLKVGREITPQKIKDLQQKDDLEKAYQRALNYLSYRIRSEEEIRRNLKKHQVDPEMIEGVLDRLRDQSLVNDQEFAHQWIENRIAFHPRGKKALASELYQKGIKRPIIEESLQDLNEEMLAKRVAQKYLPRLDLRNQKEFKRKLYGYLARRGFHYSLCQQVVDQYWAEHQQQEES